MNRPRPQAPLASYALNPSGLKIGILFLILIKSNYNNLKVSGVDNPMKELIQNSFYLVNMGTNLSVAHFRFLIVL